MKWCENVVKSRWKDGKIVDFIDFIEFVEYVVEVVNDLIYSKEVFYSVRIMFKLKIFLED